MTDAHASLDPSPWVLRWLDRLEPGVEVLDLACGSGRHAAAALARGMRVTAVDRDADALRQVPVEARRIEADLENDAWPLAGPGFDAIVVANYLHRPLFGHLCAALRPSGILIYETFAAGNARYGRPSSPAFLLDAAELWSLLAPGLHVLAYEDGFVAAPKPARVQRIAALRMPVDEAARSDLLEQFAL